CASWPRARACSSTCTRTCCGTASPATCSNPPATCAACRSCSATPTSPPPRSTPTSTSSTWPRSTTRRIRGRSGRADYAARRRPARAGRLPPPQQQPGGHAKAHTQNRGLGRRAAYVLAKPLDHVHPVGGDQRQPVADVVLAAAEG